MVLLDESRGECEIDTNQAAQRKDSNSLKAALVNEEVKKECTDLKPPPEIEI